MCERRESTDSITHVWTHVNQQTHFITLNWKCSFWLSAHVFFLTMHTNMHAKQNLNLTWTLKQTLNCQKFLLKFSPKCLCSKLKPVLIVTDLEVNTHTHTPCRFLSIWSYRLPTKVLLLWIKRERVERGWKSGMKIKETKHILPLSDCPQCKTVTFRGYVWVKV